jgi:hypothetical protein
VKNSEISLDKSLFFAIFVVEESGGKWRDFNPAFESSINN